MSWNLTRMQLRVGTVGAAAILMAAIHWAARPEQSVAPEDVAGDPAHAAPYRRQLHRETDQEETGPNDAAAAPSVPPPQTDTEESTVAQYTARKYQILLDDLRYVPAERLDRLQQALLARERLTGEPSTAQREAALANAEDRVRELLPTADHATYESLKDSDLEQFKLEEYAGGIGNVAPLDAADRKSILKTKLAYKQRFRQLLLNSGLEREDLSAAEREYAFSVTSRALRDYRSGYLQEVRQYLSNDEQFALLSNYESTEFNEELGRLQAMAGGAVGGGS